MNATKTDRKWPQLPKEFLDKWTKLLREGGFKQARCELYNPGCDSYCCLGIAGLVVGDKKERMANVPHYAGSLRASAASHIAPPEGLPKELCFVDVDYSIETEGCLAATLANMNGYGKIFAEIADWIDANLR